MEGLSGCNHFNAAYALLPTGEFNITKIGASIENCPEPGIQEQERRYLQALEEGRPRNRRPHGTAARRGREKDW